jgi:KTSC domain-containing protein
MIRRAVTSSNVASVGWEPEEEGAGVGTLEIEFLSGHVYRYAQVSELTYQECLGASSIGRYVNKRIVGRYDEERVR